MASSALLAVLRPWLSGRPLPAISVAATRAARDHRLEGWLHHLGVPLPPSAAEACRQAWIRNVAGHLRRLELLGSLWPAELPPPILFKGADLAEHLYADPGARRANDLDVLIEAPFAAAAGRALAAAAVGVLPSRHERLQHETPHATGYRISGVLIELHVAPLPAHRTQFVVDHLCARATPVQLDTQRVRIPKPADRLTLWLLNRLKDAFCGDLTDALDGALLLRQLGDDLPAWRDEMRSLGLGPARRLAEARLTSLGLWSSPTTAPRVASRLAPPAAATRGQMPSWLQRQLFKWAVADGTGRRAMLHRALNRPARR